MAIVLEGDSLEGAPRQGEITLFIVLCKEIIPIMFGTCSRFKNPVILKNTV